jgi:hypothetical protein
MKKKGTADSLEENRGFVIITFIPAAYQAPGT